MNRMRTFSWPFAAAFLTTMFSGCGRGGVGATAVGGLKIDGKPAPAGVRVDFQPQGEKGSPSMGITDPQGRYELFFTAARKGVMPGECLVRLSIMPEYGYDGIPKTPEALKDLRIPDTYSRKSTLIRTVKPGHNTIDIEIDTTSPPTKPK
jgi:hypothetical protein